LDETEFVAFLDVVDEVEDCKDPPWVSVVLRVSWGRKEKEEKAENE
jgi:hypothetical protein